MKHNFIGPWALVACNYFLLQVCCGPFRIFHQQCTYDPERCQIICGKRMFLKELAHCLTEAEKLSRSAYDWEIKEMYRSEQSSATPTMNSPLHYITSRVAWKKQTSAYNRLLCEVRAYKFIARRWHGVTDFPWIEWSFFSSQIKFGYLHIEIYLWLASVVKLAQFLARDIQSLSLLNDWISLRL